MLVGVEGVLGVEMEADEFGEEGVGGGELEGLVLVAGGGAHDLLAHGADGIDHGGEGVLELAVLFLDASFDELEAGGHECLVW